MSVIILLGEDYPTKGIHDIRFRGFSEWSRSIGINEQSGGANNETKGSYTCQVIYNDYQNKTRIITSPKYDLKLKVCD
jgi:hypothetical protein